MTAGVRDDKSIRERAYVHIQRKIASGELAPGSAVSELALSKELGSSRTPIREAIGQLVAEGLLEQVPNRGAIVVKLTRQDIIELYELREALEVYAVGKVARETVNEAELHRLHAISNEILLMRDELARSGQSALDARQMHSFVTSDLSFHTLLIRMAANTRIMKVLNETRLLIRIFAMRREGHSVADLERIHGSHAAILASLAQRDSQGAMRLISEHIKTSQQERLEQYEHRQREALLRASLPVFLDAHAARESR